jgi:hypothetical protein
MFAQATQSAPAAKAPPQTVSDQDIQIMRENVRDKRKKITAANVTLSAAEAEKFWPIYDQYIQELIKINDERWALIKDYAANYKTMSDTTAQDYLKRSIDTDQQVIALRAKYVQIFQTAVSTRTTARWYQVDHRLENMINMELVSMVPIVDSK